MRNGLIKLIVKVLDENKDQLVWEHLCYVPGDLYLTFLKQKEIERVEMSDYLSIWAKRDFNIDLPMTTAKDILILRELIVNKYRTVYPHMARKTSTDRQGWVRVWVSDNMDREMQRK